MQRGKLHEQIDGKERKKILVVIFSIYMSVAQVVFPMMCKERNMWNFEMLLR